MKHPGFTVFSEDSSFGLHADIRPKQIELDSLLGKFGKYEVEESAKNLLAFFHKKDRWDSFSFQELTDFCKESGFNPSLMLFGLLGAWYDDGGLGSIRIPHDPYFLMGMDGRLRVTSNFINALTRK